MTVDQIGVKSEKEVSESARRYLSVCVLDDDSPLVEVTTERLQAAGFETIGTGDPREALDMIKAGRCGTVLTDVRMPAMDRFDLQSFVRLGQSRLSNSDEFSSYGLSILGETSLRSNRSLHKLQVTI